MFKRSQHVGQCCFYGNTEGSLGLIVFPKLFVKLQCCHVCPPLWRSINTDDGKRENASLLLLFSSILKILPVTDINKNRELKQRGRECQRERYKTIDLRWYVTRSHFFPNLILLQVVVVCEHVGPSHAQIYANWLCCCHRNALVFSFVGF